MKIDLLSNIPAPLLEAALFIENTFDRHRFEVFLVGGSVRDLILQKEISDLDFTTNATPTQVMSMFKKVIPVGLEFGTVIVLYKKTPIEITTFRKDSDYLDGRHPEKIEFGSSLKEDITRRDFTINGLAYRLKEKTLYDYCHGFGDIQNRLLRTIGNAESRFAEDGLRPIRACRFIASNGFVFDEQIYSAIEKNRNTISQIATERFYDEWRKVLKSEEPQLFWQTLLKTKIFEIFFKDMNKLVKESQRQKLLQELISNKKNNTIYYHCATLWLCEWVELSQKNYFAFSLEKEKMIKTLKSFFDFHRFPKKESDLVKDLLSSPLLELIVLFQTKQTFDLFILKRIFTQIKREQVFIHLRFFYFVMPHFFESVESIAFAQNIFQNIKTVLQQPLYLQDLSINGHHLKEMGFTGKQIGKVLQQALEHVWKHPLNNQKETLLHWLQKEKLF